MRAMATNTVMPEYPAAIAPATAFNNDTDAVRRQVFLYFAISTVCGCCWNSAVRDMVCGYCMSCCAALYGIYSLYSRSIIHDVLCASRFDHVPAVVLGRKTMEDTLVRLSIYDHKAVCTVCTAAP